KGNNVVKKELIVALKGEFYFVKFIINQEEDDVEPGVILGREELPPLVCKMGKSSRNKKRSMKNLSSFYQDIEPSSSVGRHLTQEEVAKEALAIRNQPKVFFIRGSKASAESDSDDEEEYQIKRNKFGAPIYGLKTASYLNYNDPADRSLAIQTVTNLFRKISVWKMAVSFLGSLPVPLKQVNWKPDYKGCYTKEKEATGKW
nr:hypothetical protein [Tanacetum cinerariifolium]